jgi:hypothetical protein
LIPQAFTTRDMSEAYKWLQSLPPNIREEMKSMEQVVSLYLRAKRLGGAVPGGDELGQASKQAAHEAPKSSLDFQKALKGLKHELEQFDFAPNAQQPTLTPQQTAPENQQQPQQQPPSPPAQQQVTPPHQPSIADIPAHAPNILSSLRLDPKSRQIVNEVRDGLNLSSDMEVIRMSLILAHKKLKELL